MRLIKHEHAAVEIVERGRRLFIDPGKFTTPITEAADTVAVVITHEHDDHWTPEQLRRILEQNPDARVFGPDGVVRAAAAAGIEVEAVHAGDRVDVDPFTVEFFGGTHAVIHASIPVIDNLGVVVNDRFAYAGDSFASPGRPVQVLAVPANAPWMKVAEAIDFVLEVQPQRAFPTHEMLLSRAGKDLANARLRWATEQGGGEYVAVEPGDSLDI